MFTRTINVTIFVGGTFDLFDVMYKQHNKSVLNPFLNGTKNDGIYGTCKRSLTFRCLTQQNEAIFITCHDNICSNICNTE